MRWRKGLIWRFFSGSVPNAVLLITCLAVFAFQRSPAWAAQPHSPKPINLRDLPDPPAEIGQLIKLGRVTFETGQRQTTAVDGGASPLAGETNFQIAYNYSSHSRWTRRPGTNQLVIRVRFGKIQWQPEHRIWLRKSPEVDRFWTNQLVLHEFDHVRISSDKRLRARFEESLRDTRVLVREISSDDVVNQSLVDRLVDEFAASQFARITEMIAIRYRELDRITTHGRRPLPADSELVPILRGTSDASSLAKPLPLSGTR